MIWVVDLEPLEQRYTKQWRKWFEREWPDCKFISALVNTDVIENGRFLDIIGTNVYKSRQVIAFCNFVRSGEITTGDTIFFMDGWHPGAIQMKYISDLMKLDLHFSAIFHAGSYDPWDFLAQAHMGHWARYIEEGLWEIFDNIFVATQYHSSLMQIVGCVLDKIHVTGLPFYRHDIAPSKIDFSKKDDLVVFTSRSDPEKQPQAFDAMAAKLPQYKFIKTLEVTKTKKEYYDLLAKAKVVYQPVFQETFGIGVLEAVSFGVLPVLPDRLSYAEMWKSVTYWEDDLSEQVQNQIADFVENYDVLAPQLLPQLLTEVDWYANSLARMREILE